MVDFLSNEWFEELNSRLASASPRALPEGAHDCEIVFAMFDAPSGRPHALTLSISEEGVQVRTGDSHAATTVVRLAFDDAQALTSGQLDSATALRDGRIKVRGDVNALVPLAAWLHAALED